MNIILTALLSSAVFSSRVLAGSPHHHGKGRTHTVGQAVRTTSGSIVGHPASSRPNVSEYLGIPFAKPPVGDLRFAAPQAYVSSGTFNATAFSPSCPANALSTTSSTGGPSLAGSSSIQLLANLDQVGNNFSEDCLTLNVWTKPQTGEKSKAVLFWMFGGGFEFGSSNSPIYNGQYFADNEDVIIVTVNYRVNIFGFPGLPGMDQNLGLLDQRLAIEWTQKNIAAFGGDPKRITIFGQSSGATSVDYYSYAWTKDPIVAGFIPESSTATGFGSPSPPNNTAAWFNTTQKLNCGGPSEGIPATVACMRTKSFQEILDAKVSLTRPTDVVGPFGPTVDNKIVFDNYRARAMAGNFIKKPYLIGTNDYEAGLFKVTATLAGLELSDRDWALFNLITFSCPAAGVAQRRAQQVPTWRYRYYGEFPNTRLTLHPSSGAWHGSEVLQVWQTAGDSTGAPDTPAENEISGYLQGAWTAFAKDPGSGLSGGDYGWPHYDPRGNSLIRLAYNNESTASYEFPNKYDLVCPALKRVLERVSGGMDEILGNLDSPAWGFLAKYENLTAMGGGSEIGY